MNMWGGGFQVAAGEGESLSAGKFWLSAIVKLNPSHGGGGALELNQ